MAGRLDRSSGAIEFDGDRVRNFREKPDGDGAMINGGFFVADPSVLDLIDSPETAATKVLRFLARDDFGQEPVADVRG